MPVGGWFLSGGGTCRSGYLELKGGRYIIIILDLGENKLNGIKSRLDLIKWPILFHHHLD